MTELIVNFAVSISGMGRIMAIDYGRKRTGLAVTDEQCLIAGPLDTVASYQVIEYLKRYTAAEAVDCFVLGKPVQMNGTDSESMQYIVPFHRLLVKTFPGIPVEWVDERFTSKMASAAIASSGLGRQARRDKALVDKVSAAILLQTYMEILSKRKNT